ncbi:MAG: hypothetical protein D6695_04995 [Planctomycetota bacterium]|nr:MAG: hypothetical protein D6695_04995 [Planctomycetota bacterium]
MAIVGALARVSDEELDKTIAELDRIDGVSTFSVDCVGKLGLLIETRSLDQAHDIMTNHISTVRGVLGAWPIYVNTEDETD